MLTPMTSPAPSPTTSTRDLLVLGGTSWLGGAGARRALDRGHRVTCLARGEAGTPPDGVTWVRADRTEPGAYDAVVGRDWDVVLDVSWQPDQVRSALAALADRAGHWVYVSSCSVYADDAVPGEAEDAAVHPAHPGSGPVAIEQYGPAKVACEEAVVAAMGPEHSTLARAGLIGGYGDRSDRLGYWPARVDLATDRARVLVPPRDTPVQVVDVQDLAAWLVHVAEHQVPGVFNALGDETTVGAVLDACEAATGRRPAYVEVGDDWLAEQGVAPWMGPESLPLWLPRARYAGFMSRRNDAARVAGLTLRPLSETWERERGLDRERHAGLTAAREAELVAAAP